MQALSQYFSYGAHLQSSHIVLSGPKANSGPLVTISFTPIIHSSSQIQKADFHCEKKLVMA